MSASSAPSRPACGFGFVLAVCASCATYVDDTAPLGSGGGGAASAGAGGTASPPGGSGGKNSEAGASGSKNQGGTKTEGGGGAGQGGTSGAATAGGGAGGGGAAGAGGQAGASGGAAGAGGKAGDGGSAGKAGGGAGGSGGGSTVVACAKNPIPAKSAWIVTASHSRPNGLDPVANTKDGVTTNRWSTGKDQLGDEWLQVDFGVAVRLSKVTLLLGSNPDDYPRKYAVRLSGSSQNTTAPVLVSGMGADGSDTVLSFPPGSAGRYLLISQGGMATALWWSVAEVQAECVD
jgi:hypothetical protein